MNGKEVGCGVGRGRNLEGEGVDCIEKEEGVGCIEKEEGVGCIEKGEGVGCIEKGEGVGCVKKGEGEGLIGLAGRVVKGRSLGWVVGEGRFNGEEGGREGESV